MAPHSQNPCRNQRQIQRKALFLRSLYFWDEKLTKPGQKQSCKFSLSLFDQVSFRSIVVRSNVVQSNVVRLSVVLSTVGLRETTLEQTLEHDGATTLDRNDT